MKNIITLVAVIVAGAALALESGENTPPETPQKIALVDMAKVFKASDRFVELRADLKDDIASRQKEAQTSVARATELRNLITKAQGKEKEELEEELDKVTRRLSTLKNTAQKYFKNKEAEIFAATYDDAMHAVRTCARRGGYSLVIRFDSSGIDKSDTEKLTKSLNRLVVYHELEHDLTSEVIHVLNGGEVEDSSTD